MSTKHHKNVCFGEILIRFNKGLLKSDHETLVSDLGPSWPSRLLDGHSFYNVGHRSKGT